MDRFNFDAKETILENGLKVITIKKDTQITAIHVGVKAGPLHEKKQEKGLSHFIEHMLFKGTTMRDNEKLNSELEQIGGDYNAYTDYGCTVYSITALMEELDTSLELLSDMVINSTFPKEEIDKERGVILAEIRTSKDDIEDYSLNKINEVGFNKSALKTNIIGEERAVRGFGKEDILKYYNKYYVPNNSYITVVSSYEHETAIKYVEKYFNCWKWQELIAEPIVVEKNNFIKQISYKQDIEQSTICYLYTFYGLEPINELILKILNHRFGGSSNSILFRKLREDRGLAYDVYSEVDMTNYVKTLYIYTAVSEDSVDEALMVIDETVENIINKKIVFDESTIELMKKVLKTAVTSTLEDSTDLGNYVLHRSMDGEDIYGFVKDMENLKLITKDDIYSVAARVFKNPTIHILLPGKDG